MSGEKNNGLRAEPCATPNITLYSNVDIVCFFLLHHNPSGTIILRRTIYENFAE